MFDARAFDGGGKLQSFFKAAVSDFHLMKRNARRARFIPAATGDIQHVSLNINFDFLRRNSGEFDLDEPAFRRLVNIR